MSTQPEADAAVVEVVLKALERAEEPIAAKTLRDQLTGPYKLAVERLEQLLQAQVSLGRVFCFEPYKSKARRYWTRSLDQYARATLHKKLSNKPVTSSELVRGLKSPLKDCSPERLRQLLRELVQAGQVRELPTFVRSRTKRLSTNPPDPRDYLKDAFQDIYRKLEKAGISRGQVDAAALEMLGPSPAAAQTEPTLPRLELSNEEIGRLILERMSEIRPGAVQGALVPLRELRRVMEGKIADKDAFDAAVLALADQGRVDLHRHDYPSSLAEEERAALIPDGRGSYFVGIALRG